MVYVEEFDRIIFDWDRINFEQAVMNCSEQDFLNLVDKLFECSVGCLESNKKESSIFSFIANTSLSGGGHPCSEMECRQVKLDGLVSFATLYADEVFIKNPFAEIFIKCTENPEELPIGLREELIFGVRNYQYLKPMIKKGLIKYAETTATFCQEHSRSIAKPLLKKINASSRRLFDFLEVALVEKCSVYFDFHDDSGPFIHIKGPESVVEHGDIYFHRLFDQSHAILEQFEGKELPYLIPKEVVLKEHFLTLIIAPIIEDLSSQEWHSQLNGSTYLCDNPFHMKIASKLNRIDNAANADSFNDAMRHCLPALYSKNLDTILALRDREEEAFNVYRDCLSRVIKTTNNWNKSELDEAFKEELLPQLNLIEKRIKDWKYQSGDSLTKDTLLTGGVLSLGYFTGMIEPEFGKTLAALSAMGVGTKFLSDLVSRFQKQPTARSSDLYFLWQANQ